MTAFLNTALREQIVPLLPRWTDGREVREQLIEAGILRPRPPGVTWGTLRNPGALGPRLELDATARRVAALRCARRAAPADEGRDLALERMLAERYRRARR